MTSVRLGAHALNYTEVIKVLHKEEDGKKVVCGARVRDKVSSKYCCQNICYNICYTLILAVTLSKCMLYIVTYSNIIRVYVIHCYLSF